MTRLRSWPWRVKWIFIPMLFIGSVTGLFACQGGMGEFIDAPQPLTGEQQQLRQDCKVDEDCPDGEVCQIATGFCRDAAFYGETPEWGMQLMFDEPIFPEIEQVDEDGDDDDDSSGTDVGRDAPGHVPPVIEQAGDVCIQEDTQVVLYMSADDSNSKASPVIARRLINEGYAVPDTLIRTYEFLNYYPIVYTYPEVGDVHLETQMVANATVPGSYVLQLGVQAAKVSNADRRVLNLTFSLDLSGSMTGDPIANLRAVMHEIAGNLKFGDVVSIVSWNTSQNILLDSHQVIGPNDETLLEVIDGVNAGGATNLNDGLRTAYELAQANYSAEYLNRVVLISDGQANVGVTDVDLIQQASEDNEQEGIYLIGVGTGVGYNDTLMDKVTDAGKGAYVFIDTPEEAKKQFNGDRFVANLDIAAMDVRLRLKLPSTFRVIEFHGEQVDGDPQKVKPQHLAPNTAMVYHQTIGSCSREPFKDEDEIEVTVNFIDPITREERTKQLLSNGAELLEDGFNGHKRPQLVKGNAVVTYAEALKRLYKTSNAEMEPICTLAQTIIDNAISLIPTDADLVEISGLMEVYCDRCLESNCGHDPFGDGDDDDDDSSDDDDDDNDDDDNDDDDNDNNDADGDDDDDDNGNNDADGDDDNNDDGQDDNDNNNDNEGPQTDSSEDVGCSVIRAGSSSTGLLSLLISHWP